MEFRSVHETRDDFAGVIGLADILRHQTMHLRRVVKWLCRLCQIEGLGLWRGQRADNGADNGERVRIMGRIVVCHAGLARMDICAAKVFG